MTVVSSHSSSACRRKMPSAAARPAGREVEFAALGDRDETVGDEPAEHLARGLRGHPDMAGDLRGGHLVRLRAAGHHAQRAAGTAGRHWTGRADRGAWASTSGYGTGRVEGLASGRRRSPRRSRPIQATASDDAEERRSRTRPLPPAGARGHEQGRRHGDREADQRGDDRPAGDDRQRQQHDGTRATWAARARSGPSPASQVAENRPHPVTSPAAQPIARRSGSQPMTARAMRHPNDGGCPIGQRSPQPDSKPSPADPLGGRPGPGSGAAGGADGAVGRHRGGVGGGRLPRVRGCPRPDVASHQDDVVWRGMSARIGLGGTSAGPVVPAARSRLRGRSRRRRRLGTAPGSVPSRRPRSCRPPGPCLVLRSVLARVAYSFGIDRPVRAARRAVPARAAPVGLEGLAIGTVVRRGPEGRLLRRPRPHPTPCRAPAPAASTPRSRRPAAAPRRTPVPAPGPLCVPVRPARGPRVRRRPDRRTPDAWRRSGPDRPPMAASARPERPAVVLARPGVGPTSRS